KSAAIGTFYAREGSENRMLPPACPTIQLLHARLERRSLRDDRLTQLPCTRTGILDVHGCTWSLAGRYGAERRFARIADNVSPGDRCHTQTDFAVVRGTDRHPNGDRLLPAEPAAVQMH